MGRKIVKKNNRHCIPTKVVHLCNNIRVVILKIKDAEKWKAPIDYSRPLLDEKKKMEIISKKFKTSLPWNKFDLKN